MAAAKPPASDPTELELGLPEPPPADIPDLSLRPEPPARAGRAAPTQSGIAILRGGLDDELEDPVAPAEIAIGELLWSLAQASLFALSFVVIMTAMGLTTVTGALAALPVAVLIGFAFGGLGLLLATFLTGWQDFDYLGAAVFLMFLFSGAFAPVEDYPTAAQVVVHLTPLFHGVSAVRDLTFGSPGWGLLVHLGYLVGVGVLGLWLASRRISRTLCR